MRPDPIEGSRDTRALPSAAMRRLAALLAVAATASACAAQTTTPTPGLAGGVTVIDVIDGDSLRVEIDGTSAQLRLTGVNAPERDECHGDVARAALEALVERPVILETTGGDDEDRFGRLLRYVISEDGSTVNLTLIETGAATVLQGDHAREDEFAAASDTAWESRLGMWSPTACGTAGSTDVRIGDVDFDPRGRDEDTNETVLLTNDGPNAVDIGGWILRDESSIHRLQIPEGTTLAAGAELSVVTGCEAEPPTIAWCSDGPVWSNGGDTAILQTPNGSTVDRLRY